jgi:predicted nucleic acid-binding protein
VAEADFVDSSALVKRYVLETGTAWVRRLTRQSVSVPFS